jgi:hypothetical protein
MAAWRARFPFTLVLMLGDNIYGTSTPHDYELKFERPYRALLDAGWSFGPRSATTTTPPRSITSRSTWKGSGITPSVRTSAGSPDW